VYLFPVNVMNIHGASEGGVAASGVAASSSSSLSEGRASAKAALPPAFSPFAMMAAEKEKTTPFGVNLMRSQVSYPAAQGLKDVEVVLARPVVPPVSSSLQCISAVVL